MAAAARFSNAANLEITVHFGCNLKCAHCMIEGTMDWLTPESDRGIAALLAENAATRQWRGVTLTGSEVTLRADLPAIARLARQSGFAHVRIQTHGMRLADLDYCHSLVDAGVDEFFISLTAADAATHDAITGVPGAFARTLQGLENLDGIAGVATATNTVITRRSFTHLPLVVQRLSHLKQISRHEFWSYFPMNEADLRNLLVPHAEVLPYLQAAIEAAEVRGVGVAVKNFPECLLGSRRAALDNSQPKLVIDPEFWPEFMRNGFHQCAFRAQCQSKQCLGLNTAYIEKFGWERHLLQPLPANPQ